MKFHSSTIDRLYLGLGFFTDLYLLSIAFEFFYNPHFIHPIVKMVLDSLSQPYFGALAVYTILKEIRKRRTHGFISLHRGEWFVAAWLALLIITTIVIIFSDRYRFDAVYQLIIANSLAVLMVYIGSRINKP